VRGGVLLDVTRTLSRLGHAADTGIDRVERAWRERVAASAGPAFFLARVSGGQVLLDRAGLAAALAGAAAPDLRARLSRKPGAVRLGESAARAAALGLAGPRGLARLLARHLPPGVTAFNLGHANLSDAVMAALGAAGARRVAMIHDTIPLDRPDLVRAESVPAHAARLRAAAAADLILANSADTAARIGHWLAALGLAAPPVRVVPLGLTPLPEGPAVPGPPRFLILGTVEPRKGHDFLLDLWAGLPPPVPELHVVGRFGWAAPALAERLRRAGPAVRWHERLDDGGLAGLLRGARGLLMPSLAEGYGLPLAEALAAGVPAIVADLPALRETGGAVPLYLPPRDAPAWAAAIGALLDESSAECRRQFTLLKSWHPTSWEAHFADALASLP
jgi:glycosyltransferase involved in cell wall biosynthesis